MLLTKVMAKEMSLGATRRADGRWEFLVWAPLNRRLSLRLLETNQSIEMEPLERGYFYAAVESVDAGARYFFRLEDGRELPDPASRFQPEGVHGPSQLVDLSSFEWSDQSWTGRPLEESIFYELHTGTFTPEGTFDAIIPHLPELANLGVTTLELMPIAQFPGARNWGYDGVYPFAPQNSYGGPEALARLVNAAHRQGLSVALDVVYNHLGPEGNYLSAYGPYFTDQYHTPWGQAINFDGAGSDEVRRYFIENALYWLENYHVDALRLDAIHGIFDFGARHFLAELKTSVAALQERLGRSLHIIAESDLNDARILRHPAVGGYGVDAQWSDDFHHSVHTLLTGEKTGYYADFGGIEPLAATLRDGWYYSGQYSEYRRRSHGNSARGLPASKFVVCNQNHDQVGNRATGERLTALVDFEQLKLAAGVTILSPFLPLLFMGEEHGEPAPFQYFTSHGDPDLVEAVRKGRREEFASFGWQDSVPDPQDEKTFQRSRLNHSLKAKEPHGTVLRFYQRLIQIRKQHRLGAAVSWSVEQIGSRALRLTYPSGSGNLSVIFNFAPASLSLNSVDFPGRWAALLDSSHPQWNGARAALPEDVVDRVSDIRLSPYSLVVLEQTAEPSESA